MDDAKDLAQQLEYANKMLDYAFDALNSIVTVQADNPTEYARKVDAIAIDAIVMLGQDK